MKNRTTIALLTVIAVLLGANLIVITANTAWAQDRGIRPTERQQERGDERPTRGAQPERRQVDRPARGDQPVRPAPQREPRLVGVTSVGNLVVLAWDNGAIESREVPSPR